MEIRVPGVDPPDPVLPHQDRGLGVIEKVPAQERRLFHDFGRDFSVRFRRNEKAEGRRGEDGPKIKKKRRDYPI